MDEVPNDERDLVEAAKRGSEAAFSELTARYYERVYHISYRILDSVEDAEEVTQETFARAVIALERFDHRATFFTWIVSIARNAAFDQLRAKKRRARLYSVEEGFENLAVDPAGGPVAQSSESEAAAIVRKGLSRLNERDRTLLVLREYENMQYEEIARVMKCSIGTIESGIHRARKKLKYYLQALDPVQDSVEAKVRAS